MGRAGVVWSCKRVEHRKTQCRYRRTCAGSLLRRAIKAPALLPQCPASSGEHKALERQLAASQAAAEAAEGAAQAEAAVAELRAQLQEAQAQVRR